MVIPEWCCFLISFSFISNFVQYFSLNVHEFIVANTRLHKTPQALNVLQYIIIKKMIYGIYHHYQNSMVLYRFRQNVLFGIKSVSFLFILFKLPNFYFFHSVQVSKKASLVFDKLFIFIKYILKCH